ncbi:hypothetical protein FIBSPDRAFT_967367 [Athelia psychrophila]|uniref:F-box domain-containing protein n=1 Tax=Athelia psychrophila TaxID=1759441 RepID=A0A167VSV1_9AGAM|nr:hypothetical protein FIBSPDRAFT_967367 [Fibularhizoctonia sp. CBS 109695]
MNVSRCLSARFIPEASLLAYSNHAPKTLYLPLSSSASAAPARYPHRPPDMASLISCPTEIHLMIISEAFRAHDLAQTAQGRPELYRFVDRRMRKERRAQRLQMFRTLSLVCSAWLDPARTVFWAEVTLFAVGDLVAFARAVQQPASKPACIRRLHFRLPLSIDQKSVQAEEELMLEAKEAKAHFPAALRLLPAHLEEFYVDCDNHYPARNHVLYHCLSLACRDPAWTIAIPRLYIGPRPSLLFDTLAHFRFARSVRALELSLTSRDDCQTFRSPLPHVQLESLALRLEFDGGLYRNHMPRATAAAAKALRGACARLRSLAVHMLAVEDVDAAALAQTMKHVFTLAGRPLAALTIAASATPYLPSNSAGFAAALAAAHAFVPCPALRTLRLHQVGIDPDVLQQLQCAGLEELEVAVSRPGCPVLKESLLACLGAPELRNLQRLRITCSDVESVSLEVFRASCANRNIVFTVTRKCDE